jgi:YHS domain-containing protein
MSKYIHMLLLFVLLLAMPVVFAQQDCCGGHEEEQPAVAAGDAYPLATCIVSGKKLEAMGKPVFYVHQGREMRFCSNDCLTKFKQSPKKYFVLLDSMIAKQQLPFYPLGVCFISGKKLGSMGEPFNYVHNNRLIRFCCSGCVAKFLKAAEKYLADLDKAVIRKQKATYPLDTCLVSGEKLGEMGEAIDFVYGNRLIRFCCKDCIKKFRTEPLKYLAKFSEPVKKNTSEDHKDHEDHEGHHH